MTATRLHLHRPRRAIVALTLCLVGLFFTVPSALAHDGGHGHGHGQSFLLISTDPSENATPTVLAFGPIHAQGTDTVVDDNHDVFTFPDGTIDVTHHARHSRDFSDPVTCLFRYTESGSYRITGGTDAYDHARGSGHYKVSVLAVGCDPNSPPTTFSLTIRAHGSIHF